jgi:hypothetical protein
MQNQAGQSTHGAVTQLFVEQQHAARQLPTCSAVGVLGCMLLLFLRGCEQG